MNPRGAGPVERHLVLHDYGMGGLWWWVFAATAEDVLEAIAEVEVVTDPASIALAEEWDDLEEFALGDTPPASLAGLVVLRTIERGHPDYGRLVGRARVHLREEEDGDVSVSELGPDGRRLRMVDLTSPEDPLRTDSWPFNPPYDLRSPALVALAITAEEFEAHWTRARPDPDAWD